MEVGHDSNEADNSEPRSRSAPPFCRPRMSRPRPYRPAPVTPPTPLVVPTPRPATRSFAASASTPTPSPASSRPVPETPPPVHTARPASNAPAATVHTLWGEADDEDEDDDRDEAWDQANRKGWVAIARGVALLLGTLLLVDLFAKGGMPAKGPWWLATNPLPPQAVLAGLGTSAASFLLFAVRGSLPRGVRGVGLLCVGLMTAIAIKNTTIYYGLLQRGDLHAGPSIAFSLHVAGCLAMVFLAIRSAPGKGGLAGTFLTFLGVVAAALAWPLAHIACEGTIDARRSAATAIVAGPRAFEELTEEALQQRIDRAVELHAAGLTPAVVMTASVNTEQLAWMRERAIASGVPASSVEVIADDDVRSVLTGLAERVSGVDDRAPVVLVISDATHLPRLMLEGRETPVTLASVPCASLGPPRRDVIAQEILALWRCYLRR